MARCSFRCNLVDRYSTDSPNYHRLMVRFRIAIDCLTHLRTGSPSRYGFRFHWKHSQKRNHYHWSNWAPSSLATNSSVPSDYRCLDLANPIDSPIGCRFPSWSIHSPNYRIDCFHYRSNRSGWSHCHWMRLSSWRCRNYCSWHRLSTNRFRATNPIHSIQTDWNPICSNLIGLSQTHWSLIHWNHWIGLNHSTQSLIRSTSNCSSTKAHSVMSIRLNHFHRELRAAAHVPVAVGLGRMGDGALAPYDQRNGCTTPIPKTAPADPQAAGYFIDSSVVHLRPDQMVEVGGTLEALAPLVQDHVIVAYAPFQPPLLFEVTDLGTNPAFVRVDGPIAGLPPGTVVRWAQAIAAKTVTPSPDAPTQVEVGQLPADPTPISTATRAARPIQPTAAPLAAPTATSAVPPVLSATTAPVLPVPPTSVPPTPEPSATALVPTAPPATIAPSATPLPLTSTAPPATIAPSATQPPPTLTAAPPTLASATATPVAALIFLQEAKAEACIVQNRLRNDNAEAVEMYGVLHAQPTGGAESVIAETPNGMEMCGPGAYCGPIEDLRNRYPSFQGTVWGVTNVYRNGQLVASYSFGPISTSCVP